jgi:hypothetical protein
MCAVLRQCTTRWAVVGHRIDAQVYFTLGAENVPGTLL